MTYPEQVKCVKDRIDIAEDTFETNDSSQDEAF